MPYEVPMTLNHLRDYERAKILLVKFDTIKSKVEDGAQLIQECSSFKDPGEDWTAVWLEYPDGNRERVAYWPGY